MKNTKISAQGGNKIMHNVKWFLLSLTLGLFLGGGLIAVNAWTDPTLPAPGGNVGAPINTSANVQIKAGVLQTNGFRNIGTTILDGNVGVGTTVPTQKLDVVGNVKGTQLCIGNDCRNAWPTSSGIGGNGTSGRIPKWTSASTQGDSIISDNGTNVGIGIAAPAYKMHVSGTLGTTGGAILNTGGAANGLIVQAGNVGIGDATPDAGTGGQLKLDVAGNIGATRYCDAAGSNCRTITEMGAVSITSYTRISNGTVSCNSGDIRTGCSANAYNVVALPSLTNSCDCHDGDGGETEDPAPICIAYCISY